jgi:parallel beta-helix repeat protein
MSDLKKIVVLGIVLLFPLVSGGLLLGQTQKPVKNVDTSETFDSIQDAIDDSDTVNGHTIEVIACTLYENIIIDKSITLQGYHMFSTYIQGDCSSDVVKITASGVTIKDLFVSGCGDTESTYNGILIDSNNNVIENTVIAESYRNIFINNGKSGNIIRDNWVSTTYDYFEGITVSGSYNKIYGNTIFRALTSTRVGMGIIILGAVNCDIYQNDIWYLEYGIYDASGQNNKTYANTIHDNDYGIYTFLADDNDIYSNIFEDNEYGLYLYCSAENRIIANEFEDNEEGLYLKTDSNDNVVHRNNFINNSSHHAYIDNTYTSHPCLYNSWYDVNTSVGNYWDDHTCVDSDTDGICDDAYTIPSSNGSGDQDSYPLASQWVTVCGNVNGDINGDITLADIYYLICYVYNNCSNPLPPVPLCAGDVNGDGYITLGDISILIYFYNYGGSPPSGCPCN